MCLVFFVLKRNRRRGGVPWTIGDVYLTLESEFGISVFDLDALLRTVGISNPRLRTAVLNLHREIHQAVASSSSGKQKKGKECTR